MDNINLEIVIDKLTIENWFFYRIGYRGEYILQGYDLLKKKTPRHKFRVIKRYDRTDQRNNTIEVDEVPLTENIKAMVLQKVIDNFKCEK